MNDDQLPKPSVPASPAPMQQNQPASAAPSNTGGEAIVPPPSAFRQPAAPTGGNQATSSPNPAQSQPQQAVPQRPLAPPGAPPSPQAAGSTQPMGSPLAASRLGGSQANQESKLPPTTLSALSSMSSTQLPNQQNQESAPEPEQRTTSKPRVTSTPQQPIKTKSAKSEKTAAADPKFAGQKKPLLKFLPIILGVLALLGVAGFAAMRFLGGNTPAPVQTNFTPPPTSGGDGGQAVAPGKQVTLEYWGLWEPNEVVQEVIAAFEKDNPGVTIQYTKQSHQDYRQRLQTAIASGNGPDVYRFHASWVPMLSDELAPIPSTVVSAADFRQKYYPVVQKQLQRGGQIVGIPLMYDGLALLYNQEVFDAAGESPPQTWAEVRSLASKLTVRSGNDITRAGIALGTANNVEHFSDILALLMLQNGSDLTKPNSAYTRDAMKFYVNFVKTDRVWSATLPASSVAFSRGDVAMIFAPSWKIHEIQAMNPTLKFGVAPVPKLGDEKIAWATYWAEGINSKSQNKEAAAVFLKYLSSEEVLKKLYDSAAKTRSFGEIYPQVQMADQLAGDQNVRGYLQDAPNAQGWFMSSFTHDNGLNDQIIKYYEDAINAMVNDGKSVENVLSTVDQGVRQVLRQYNADAASEN